MKFRILGLIVAMALVMSLFAGCGNKGATVGRNNTEEVVELTMFLWDLDDVGNDPEAPVYKYISDKFNVKIKPSTTSYNQRNEKLNLLIAANNVPDIFISPGFESKAIYDKWIKEGIVMPISDYSSKYPNVQKVLDTFSEYAKLSGGKHYGLPIISRFTDLDSLGENKVSNGHGIWIRQDWLNNLGLEKPKTYMDLYNVAKAFTENDPDQNGKKDTYGITVQGVWWTYPILNMFNASLDRFREVDGKYVPENISEDMRAAVNYLHKLHYEGILDPDFAFITEDQKLEKFISGKTGIITHNVGGHYTTLYNKFKSAYPDKDPKSLFTWVDVIEGPNGVRRMDGSENFWCLTHIHNNISDIKKEKLLSILDFLLSEEGQILTYYGIEGEHYVKEGDKYVSLLPNNENGEPQTIKDIDKTANIYHYVFWAVDNHLMPKSQHQAEIDASAATSRQFAWADPLKFMVLDEAVFSTVEKKELYSLTTQSLTKMIMSTEQDINKEFDEYVEQWKKMKGDVYIEEANKYMNGQK